MKINVNRDRIWVSTLADLSTYHPHCFIFSSLHIAYDNEEGIDAGGI